MEHFVGLDGSPARPGSGSTIRRSRFTELALHGRNGATVDDILGSGGLCRTRGGEERDEVSDLLRLCGAAKGNAAKRVHQALARALVVSAAFLRQSVDELHRRLRLDPAGRHPDDTDALRTHLLG